VRVRDSALLLLRYAFWFLAAELILHFFYFSALQFNPQIMEVSFRNVAAYCAVPNRLFLHNGLLKGVFVYTRVTG
jgi:hypothetical protein